ncbi:MAG: sugar nucleotide-binding protein [Gemmataceae bacterium]
MTSDMSKQMKTHPRVLVFGARGYMGQQFLARFPGAVGSDRDIADPFAVGEVLDAHRPDIVINCAGKTGRPNVDWCETNQRATYRANVTGARVVLIECLRRNAYLVHLSSGCIYEGHGSDGNGFTETDRPNYTGSYYSLTKGISDQMMRGYPVLTLRLRMPFDGTLSERNLLNKIRRYERVLDMPNSVTYLPDFFRSALLLIERRATGIFNMVNDGAISPFEIMGRYRELVHPEHRFARLAVEDLPEVARAGRSNCTLSTAKLHREGVAMQSVKQAIDEALTQLSVALRSEPTVERTLNVHPQGGALVLRSASGAGLAGTSSVA